MRRGLVFIGIGALLFAAAAIAGFVAAAVLAPGQLRLEAERRLSAQLNAVITLGELDLSLRGGLRLETLGARAEGSWGRLDIDRAECRLDPLALVLGRFELRRLLLEGAELVLASQPGPTGIPAGAAREAEIAPERAGAWLEESIRHLTSAALPARRVELRGGSVKLETAEGQATDWLENLRGQASRSVLRPRRTLELSGRVVGTTGPASPPEAGHIQLSGESSPTGLEATLSLKSVDLRRLALLLGAQETGLEARGRVTGEIHGKWMSGEPARLDFDLTGSRLAGRLPRAGRPPLEITLPRLQLRSRVVATADQIRVRSLRFSDGSVPILGSGTLSLPLEDSSRLELALSVGELPLSSAIELVRRLPEQMLRGLEPTIEAVEEGRLVALSVTGTSTLAGWREILASNLLGRPGDVKIQLEVRDAVIRVGVADRLERVSGALTLDGDRLEIRGLMAHFRGNPLPRLDGELHGFSNIRSTDEPNCVKPPPVPSLPGIRPLADWVRSRRRTPHVQTWQRLRLEADWVSHPTLLCSMEQVAAELHPAEGGLDVTVEHGVWAGFPVSGSARYRERPEGDPEARDSVFVEARLGPPFEAMALDPPVEPWTRGRFEADATRLGQWRIRGARGAFHGSGAQLRLEELELDLNPGGIIRGRVALELGDPDRLPFRAAALAEGVEISDVVLAAGAAKSDLTGSLHGSGSIDGELLAGQSPLAAARGLLSLHGRNGVIRRNLSPFLAIAVANDRLNPFREEDEIAYKAIDLVVRVEDGAFRSEFAALDAPSVRMVGTGELGVSSPHDLEVVLGIFFFPGLDSLIDRLPLLNRVILGHNRNLLGAYYALSGSWSEPTARLIPIKSIAAGPASFVLEDIPAFVWGGLKRIQSVILPETEAPESIGTERADS